jgi:hypothetical protein
VKDGQMPDDHEHSIKRRVAFHERCLKKKAKAQSNGIAFTFVASERY